MFTYVCHYIQRVGKGSPPSTPPLIYMMSFPHSQYDYTYVSLGHPIHSERAYLHSHTTNTCTCTSITMNSQMHTGMMKSHTKATRERCNQ